jgi:hypothetical protein
MPAYVRVGHASSHTMIILILWIRLWWKVDIYDAGVRVIGWCVVRVLYQSSSSPPYLSAWRYLSLFGPFSALCFRSLSLSLSLSSNFFLLFVFLLTCSSRSLAAVSLLFDAESSLKRCNTRTQRPSTYAHGFDAETM